MFKTGTWVGAGRWPNQKLHPDFWQKPLRGQVLDFCDVRAWANSVHFPEDTPHSGAVMGHALALRAQGVLEGLTPVCWEFGEHQRVLWERDIALHAYEEDVALWREARASRLDQLRHPRRRKSHDGRSTPATPRTPDGHERPSQPQQQRHLALM